MRRGRGSATHRVKHERVREAGSAFSPGARFLSPTVGAVPGRGHRGEAGEEATGGDCPLRAHVSRQGQQVHRTMGTLQGSGPPTEGLKKRCLFGLRSRPYTAVCM